MGFRNIDGKVTRSWPLTPEKLGFEVWYNFTTDQTWYYKTCRIIYKWEIPSVTPRLLCQKVSHIWGFSHSTITVGMLSRVSCMITWDTLLLEAANWDIYGRLNYQLLISISLNWPWSYPLLNGSFSTWLIHNENNNGDRISPWYTHFRPTHIYNLPPFTKKVQDLIFVILSLWHSVFLQYWMTYNNQQMYRRDIILEKIDLLGLLQLKRYGGGGDWKTFLTPLPSRF